MTSTVPNYAIVSVPWIPPSFALLVLNASSLASITSSVFFKYFLHQKRLLFSWALLETRHTVQMQNFVTKSLYLHTKKNPGFLHIKMPCNKFSMNASSSLGRFCYVHRKLIRQNVLIRTVRPSGTLQWQHKSKSKCRQELKTSAELTITASSPPALWIALLSSTVTFALLLQPTTTSRSSFAQLNTPASSRASQFYSLHTGSDNTTLLYAHSAIDGQTLLPFLIRRHYYHFSFKDTTTISHSYHLLSSPAKLK